LLSTGLPFLRAGLGTAGSVGSVCRSSRLARPFAGRGKSVEAAFTAARPLLGRGEVR